ncbi:hypothetical protein LCI18_006672 [Fusarium solani-melongenae]|uniref:Uncharacterized protein n=1 Tax=Fusarium solani subsp. cucurbitae TaxID=2747967 RepID=A0ACD3Z3S3_FUSSC|nr:hypothetical protein LCI18_006672 [Fusarium solani-melongenae]
MEVALTFGSLGDIIAICQVAIQLGRAIGVGSGVVGESAKEYQDFREDLDAFVRILMQVVATYQQHEFSPYLDGLDNAAKSVIDQCGSLIQDTLEHIQPKYHESLRVGGSGKKMNDIYRKIEWSMREKDRLRYTQERLQDGVQRLSLLTTLAARRRAADTFYGMLEVKALLFQMSQTVINLQVMASHSMFLRPLDPTKELPVILEDALGNELPIPAQWLDSLEWEVLYGLLNGHFKGRNGYDMVLKREYALEESSSGRDLDMDRPLHFCLRRGMKINMSMIFNASTVVTGACPRCNKVTDVPEDVTIQCDEMYNVEMDERGNERRHAPARAFQFGNNIIIEDEDGEVIKTYELPTSKDHNTDDSKSSVASSEVNCGGVFGRAVASERVTKESVVAETEAADDKDIRFTIGGVSQRMTKDEFIREVQKLDPDAEASPEL